MPVWHAFWTTFAPCCCIMEVIVVQCPRIGGQSGHTSGCGTANPGVRDPCGKGGPMRTGLTSTSKSGRPSGCARPSRSARPTRADRPTRSDRRTRSRRSTKYGKSVSPGSSVRCRTASAAPGSVAGWRDTVESIGQTSTSCEQPGTISDAWFSCGLDQLQGTHDRMDTIDPS
jgi:hypothetical protein